MPKSCGLDGVMMLLVILLSEKNIHFVLIFLQNFQILYAKDRRMGTVFFSLNRLLGGLVLLLGRLDSLLDGLDKLLGKLVLLLGELDRLLGKLIPELSLQAFFSFRCFLR